MRRKLRAGRCEGDVRTVRGVVYEFDSEKKTVRVWAGDADGGVKLDGTRPQITVVDLLVIVVVTAVFGDARPPTPTFGRCLMLVNPEDDKVHQRGSNEEESHKACRHTKEEATSKANRFHGSIRY